MIFNFSDFKEAKVSGRFNAIGFVLENKTCHIQLHGDDKFAIGVCFSSDSEAKVDFGITWHEAETVLKKNNSGFDIENMVETVEFKNLVDSFIEYIFSSLRR
jgi:hypothetical protein